MDILLNDDGDLDLTNNRIKFTETSSSLIRQRMRISLHMNKGEWQFNINKGLPWITHGNNPQILSKSSEGFADAVIRAAILETEGVRSISKFNRNFDKQLRTYSLSIEVQLDDATTVELFEVF